MNGSAVLLIALVALLIAACGGQYRQPDTHTYTVQAGDTLYSIAWRNSLDYRDLARWNNISSDYRIYPGQVLRLTPRGGTRVAKIPDKPAVSAAPRAAKPPAPPPAENVTAWVWPAEGSSVVVRHAPTGSQGITIAGREGQVIMAAAPGKVVYTGSGLRGFGQLVIVKHTNVFLSAYGHNRAVSVKEGDAVTMGQPIAEMGLGPDRKPLVYFEIRYNGKPVDPALYLPKQAAGGK